MTQIWIPESFRERPYARLHFVAIAAWAVQNHPFYRRRITQPSVAVPIVGREEILDNNDELLNGHPQTALTSGSTGIPVRLAHSPEFHAWAERANQRFVRELGGLLPRTRLVWADAKSPADDLMDIRFPVDEQIAFMQARYQRAAAVAVTTYPSNAEWLCRRILELGLDMGFVQRFGCYAEALEPYQRELIRAAFPNARLWTSYSSIEFGLIATVCPHEPDFHHVMADRLGLEVLDAQGKPCPDGKVGRVVLTDYFNRHSSLIRYELGDLAVPGNCPCGRIALPSLRAVIGKVRGALLHRNGNRVVCTALSFKIAHIDGVRQFQVVQETLEHFVLRLVCKPEHRRQPQLEAAVKAAFVEHFSYLPGQLELHYEEHIPRGANGKFYYSICKV